MENYKEISGRGPKRRLSFDPDDTLTHPSPGTIKRQKNNDTLVR